MKKQFRKLFTLVAFCGVMATASQIKVQDNSGQLFVGIGYYAGTHGASNEAQAAVGLLGVVESTALGAIYGSVCPVAGTIVGAAIGL